MAAYCTSCGIVFPLDPGCNFCAGYGAAKPMLNPQTLAVAGAGFRQGQGNHPPPSDGSVKSSKTRAKAAEAKIVNQRMIPTFKIPKLANDAAEQRGWVVSFLAIIRKYDITSTGDTLWHWLKRAFVLNAKEADFKDCESCPHLDGLIASDLMDQRHYAGRAHLAPLFFQFQSYTEQCMQKNHPPSGRWMLSMYHRQYNTDAATGNLLTEQQLYQIPLEGFTQAHIQKFYDAVNYTKK